MAGRLHDVILRGLAADRPLSADVAPATLYFSTDTNVLERNRDDMTGWDSYSGVAAGVGNVSGPAVAVDSHIPQFDGTTGKLLKDGLGVATVIATPGVDTQVATEKAVRDAITAIPASGGDVDGPASALNNEITLFDGTTGKLIKGSGAGLTTSVGSPGVDTLVPTEKAVRTAIGSGGGGSGGGAVVQVKNFQTGAYQLTTPAIPIDDTIPQITEGAQLMTLSFTPTKATNKLKIDVVVYASTNTTGWNMVGLFQDAIANAIASFAHYENIATGGMPIVFSHYMDAGTVSAINFQVRGGSDAIRNYEFNGGSGGRRLGGSMASSITVTEIDPSGAAGAPISNSAIIQTKNFQTGAVATGTTLMPLDDTIPQNTEGDEYMSLAITPTNAASLLKIDVVFYCSHSASNWAIAALFKDSIANALASFANYQNIAGGAIAVIFSHQMTAGTTSATTFKVRAGAQGAGTMTFNGLTGGRLFGGVMTSSITITEINPVGTGAVLRRQATIVIDGAGGVITTGFKTFLSMPAAGALKKWRLLSIDTAATAGSIVIDIWKDSYGAYPPTVADTITAAAKPTLSAVNKNENSTLTGWTTAFAAGDTFGFNVDSVATLTKVMLILEFE